MNISKKYKKLRPKPKLSQCTQKLWITENYRRSLKSMEEMCVKAVDVIPYYLKYVPDCFKTQEMCVKVFNNILDYSREVDDIPDYFKTQEMCDRAIDANPYYLKYVPDCFITQEMCVKAVDANPYYIKYVPDCFITQEMIENGGRCYDSCCDSCDGELHEWFNGYNERKAQKAQIKAELLPIAWHPDRVIDWCFDEEEKKDLMRLWGSVDL